jgi:hypothetical protein
MSRVSEQLCPTSILANRGISQKEHNFVAIFQSDKEEYHESMNEYMILPELSADSKQDWDTRVDASAVLKTYSDFHPTYLAVLK